MNKQQYADYAIHRKDGIDLRKANQIRFNSGSETAKHVVGKALMGHLLHINGYRVDSEVDVGDGAVDILAWGHEDRQTLAVELEHDIMEDTIQSKKNRYVDRQRTVDDILVINLDEMPENIFEAFGYLADETGLHV